MNNMCYFCWCELDNMSLLVLLCIRYMCFAFSKTQEIFCFIPSNRKEIWEKIGFDQKKGGKVVIRMFPLTHRKLHLSSSDWGLRAPNSLSFWRKTMWVLCRVLSCLWQQLVKTPFSSTDNSVSFWPSRDGMSWDHGEAAFLMAFQDG